jgi:hypothetical protein
MEDMIVLRAERRRDEPGPYDSRGVQIVCNLFAEAVTLDYGNLNRYDIAVLTTVPAQHFKILYTFDGICGSQFNNAHDTLLLLT